MSIVTKEGVTVRVGQVWRDLDVRMNGRLVKVVAVNEMSGRAIVRRFQNGAVSGKESTLSVKRMHETSQGFVLVSEPSA